MDNLECSVCGGEKGILGRLGWVLHLICRNCGMQSSIELEEGDYTEQDENEYYEEFAGGRREG